MIKSRAGLETGSSCFSRELFLHSTTASITSSWFIDHTARFLGCVDLRGTTWQSDSIATGFGSYLAQPLLRKAMEKHGENMTAEQAAKLLDDCMRVLFYRDARSLNRVCLK